MVNYMYKQLIILHMCLYAEHIHNQTFFLNSLVGHQTHSPTI